jgi:hypothetical protein
MFRKTIFTLFFLVSAISININAQQPTPVQRLGITGSTIHLQVWTITTGSPADRGGLALNDQLMIFDTQPLATGQDMLIALGTAATGQHELTVLRNGKVKQIHVMLGPVGSSRLGAAFISGVRVEGIERDAPVKSLPLRRDDLITSLRINDKVLSTPTVADLVKFIDAVPASQPFGVVFARDQATNMGTMTLTSAPTADASVLEQAPGQTAFSRGEQATSRSDIASSPARPEPQGGGRFNGGERQGDYVAQQQDAQAAPSPGGRGVVTRPGKVVNDPAALGQAVQDARAGRMAQRMRGASVAAGGGALHRNATLDQMLVKTSYTPAAALSKRVTEINVLKFAFIDKNTGEVVFTGAYDPTYATGPIPYSTLLADAMQNPYPRFTLEYPGNSSPLAQMRATLDQEFAHISRDPNYGVEWLGNLVLPVLKGDSPDPDQQAALNAHLKAAEISPESYRAYMKWQLSKFEDMQAYSEGAKDFLPSVFAAMGMNRKTGEEITAYRVFATQENRETLDQWCAAAGQTDLELQIDQKIRETGNHHLASMELIPVLYTSILRGLGVPEGQLNQINSSYRTGGGDEGLFVRPLEEKYQAIFKQVLMDKVVNGMSFTGATLSRQYGFPTIQSALNTYGARRDSPVMDVFFKADYILKFMTSSSRPAESIPDHQTSQAFLADAENRAGGSAGRTPKSGVIRYWLYPQAVQMDTLDGNSGVRFRDASVRVGVESLEQEGADRNGTDFFKSTLDRYSSHLTSRYEQYAKIYPALHTLRETEKVVALARWAQKNGVRIRLMADDGPKTSLPDSADGFWGMTYIVRPSGDTDTMVTWAQGGVDFGQSAGDSWMQSGPPDRQVTDDALRSLAASTALSEKAAIAAKDGDLESARDLAERGAQAMSGNIDFSNIPKVPMPAMPEPDPASAAAVSEASIAAVDVNVQGLKEANQDLTRASSLNATDPAQAAQLRQQGQELKSRSDADLTRLQTMLQEYRNSPSSGYKVAVDLRNLNPYKSATVAILPPPALLPQPPTVAPVLPAKEPCLPEVAQALPPREVMLTELAQRRADLANLTTTIQRFSRTIQLDQKQYADWEDEATKAVERLTKRRDDLIQEATFKSFAEVLKLRLDRDNTLTDLARKDQERRLKLFEDLKTFSDYKEWALANKDDWEKMDEGFRQALDMLPLEENPELAISIKAAENLVDNVYDLTQYQLTWENLARLDHNSAQYLEIVKRNGQKMKDTVEKIKDLESKLNGTPRTNAKPCKAVEGSRIAR